MEILDEAQEDLIAGFHSYEGREAGLRVHAVLDCRRNPMWIRKRLKEGG